MQKIQIWEKISETNGAGGKARNDIKNVLQSLDFETMSFVKRKNNTSFIGKINQQYLYLSDWNKVYSNIKNNSILFIQIPFLNRELCRNHFLIRLKKNKKVKIISLIHDVDELRKNIFTKSHLKKDKKEMNFLLNLSDKIIVHNHNMIKFFVNKGVASDKLINLEIFDYLRNNYKSNRPSYSNVINIAGNLDRKKASYLYDLNKLHVKFNLFGPNYSKLYNSENIFYKGNYSTVQIPLILNEGFGLIWDGNSIYSCNGSTGNYLKYNDPHKLSLYLSSNLPVIIWNKAGEADFIRKNGIGLTVSSLQEIAPLLASLNENKYNTMVNNVQIVAKKLISGKYTKNAVKKAIQNL